MKSSNFFLFTLSSDTRYRIFFFNFLLQCWCWWNLMMSRNDLSSFSFINCECKLSLQCYKCYKFIPKSSVCVWCWCWSVESGKICSVEFFFISELIYIHKRADWTLIFQKVTSEYISTLSFVTPSDFTLNACWSAKWNYILSFIRQALANNSWVRVFLHLYSLKVASGNLFFSFHPQHNLQQLTEIIIFKKTSHREMR